MYLGKYNAKNNHQSAPSSPSSSPSFDTPPPADGSDIPPEPEPPDSAEPDFCEPCSLYCCC